MSMSQALEIASLGAAAGPAAASSAASAVCIYYVVIGERFAPAYKYMVKYIFNTAEAAAGPAAAGPAAAPKLAISRACYIGTP